MTTKTAIARLMKGESLFVHTPDPPQETFYFFIPDFTTVSIPLGRRLRKLDGLVMLSKEPPDHPGVLYFYWKLGTHATREETCTSAALFAQHDRLDDAQALKTQLPHHFTSQGLPLNFKTSNVTLPRRAAGPLSFP